MTPRRRVPRTPSRARRRGPRSRLARETRRYRGAAESRLSRFRTASALAVGLTGLLLVTGGAGVAGEDGAAGPPPPAEAPAVPGGPAGQEAAEQDAGPGAGQSVEEATGALRSLARDAWTVLPKVGIALALLVFAALLARLVRAALRRILGSWERAEGASALGAVLIWLLAVSSALAVVAGDPRALLGSLGLVGLALSWSLQTPIESFTGWLMNSFRGYYRVGDRIAVGEVFGDVHQIDFLTTTVWEAGRQGAPVQGATGGIVTFPNAEVLRGNVVNYTGDFPYVWDELTVAVGPESDLGYALTVVRDAADALLGEEMEAAAAGYRRLLERAGLPAEVEGRPRVFAAPADAWHEVTVRYLVPARRRRARQSELFVRVNEELSREEHEGRITPALPRQYVEQLPTPRWVDKRPGGASASQPRPPDVPPPV